MSKKTSTAKGKPKGKAAAPVDGISISGHPRAQRSIRRARGWGGLIGFALVLWVSLQAGVPDFEAGLRALAGGLVFQLLAWAVAVGLWKRLMIAELEAARARPMVETAGD